MLIIAQRMEGDRAEHEWRSAPSRHAETGKEDMTTQQIEQDERTWDATGIPADINEYWKSFTKSENAEGDVWYRTNPVTLVDVTIDHRTGRRGDKSYWAANCSWGVVPEDPTRFLPNGATVRNRIKAEKQAKTTSSHEDALHAAVLLEGFWQSWVPAANLQMGKKDVVLESGQVIDWTPHQEVPKILTGRLDPALAPDLNDGFAPAQPQRVSAPEQPTQAQVTAAAHQSGVWIPDGTQREYFNR